MFSQTRGQHRNGFGDRPVPVWVQPIGQIRVSGRLVSRRDAIVFAKFHLTKNQQTIAKNIAAATMMVRRNSRISFYDL
jgi:hypothetical protein